MTDKTKKTVKVIAVIIIILIVLYIGYKMLYGTSVQFEEYPQKDIAGFDISQASNVTLDQAKAKAVSLKAAAFVYYPEQKKAWFKSSAANMTDGWNPGTYSVYVPKA